jgi:hypothetical protein
MNIEKLKTILPPPLHPLEPPAEGDWNKVNSWLGGVPDDYKTFLDSFGTGCTGEFLWIFNPASSNKHLNFSEQCRRQQTALKDAIENWSDSVGPPNALEFVPFGISDNGDVLGWKAQESPDKWTIVVFPPREIVFREYDMNFTQFLVGICAGTIVCDLFPPDFPGDLPNFVPYKETRQN